MFYFYFYFYFYSFDILVIKSSIRSRKHYRLAQQQRCSPFISNDNDDDMATEVQTNNSTQCVSFYITSFTMTQRRCKLLRPDVFSLYNDLHDDATTEVQQYHLIVLDDDDVNINDTAVEVQTNYFHSQNFSFIVIITI